MQCAAVRIIVSDECFDLARPVRQHDLLPRAMPDLDRGAVAWGGGHVAEQRIAGHARL
jgi:hypothetical protein